MKVNNEFKKSQAYKEASEAHQLVVGPVKDTARAIKNKTKLAIQRLKDMGKA